MRTYELVSCEARRALSTERLAAIDHIPSHLKRYQNPECLPYRQSHNGRKETIAAGIQEGTRTPHGWRLRISTLSKVSRGVHVFQLIAVAEGEPIQPTQENDSGHAKHHYPALQVEGRRAWPS